MLVRIPNTKTKSAPNSDFYSEIAKSTVHNRFIEIRQTNYQNTLCPIAPGNCSLSKRDFDKLLLEAVDQGFSSLGESSKQAIYFHLEKRFNIKKQEIPHKIEAFADALEKIFGPGANFLEILIMKQLHEKVGQSFKWPEYKELTFIEYVAAAKRSFVWNKRTNKVAEGLVQWERKMVEG